MLKVGITDEEAGHVLAALEDRAAELEESPPGTERRRKLFQEALALRNFCDRLQKVMQAAAPTPPDRKPGPRPGVRRKGT